jgi:hypothetical protein
VLGRGSRKSRCRQTIQNLLTDLLGKLIGHHLGSWFLTRPPTFVTHAFPTPSNIQLKVVFLVQYYPGRYSMRRSNG